MIRLFHIHLTSEKVYLPDLSTYLPSYSDGSTVSSPFSHKLEHKSIEFKLATTGTFLSISNLVEDYLSSTCFISRKPLL